MGPAAEPKTAASGFCYPRQTILSYLVPSGALGSPPPRHTVTYTLFSLKFNKAIVSLIVFIYTADTWKANCIIVLIRRKEILKCKVCCIMTCIVLRPSNLGRCGFMGRFDSLGNTLSLVRNELFYNNILTNLLYKPSISNPKAPTETDMIL